MTLNDCIVFAGADLEPRRCRTFKVEGDSVTTLELGEPALQIDNGAHVVIPGLYNAHTHMGDSILPDGATGLTLEQGFFRPNGYKYRELAKIERPQHLEHVCAHLRYMARTGTVCHLDFREQGPYGSELLREASELTGVESVILGQFDGVPFDAAALKANSAELAPADLAELNAILDVADGFSESTMNDLTEPAWRQIRELTTRRGKLRAIHCLENAGYREVSLALTGRGDLERALDLYDPFIIVHLTVANAVEIARLAHSGTIGVLNPRANANLGLPLPPIPALLDAGINLLLGTDNGLLNSPSMLTELDYTYKLTKSLYGDAVRPDPLAILRMAASNIRPALGGDHYGYLETGLPASFVVLNFHQPHLRRSRHLPASVLTRVTPEDVLATYRQGKPLYQADGYELN
ncbi:MAG: amidohydrolase family protein [Opitutales bacterium]